VSGIEQTEKERGMNASRLLSNHREGKERKKTAVPGSETTTKKGEGREDAGHVEKKKGPIKNGV